MVTCEVRNNKLYSLIFSEYAKWLIENTTATVLFSSSGNPSIKVSKSNFEYCDKLNRKSLEEAIWNNYFILEQELPALKITTTDKGYDLNSNYRSAFYPRSFDNIEIWRNKEIERRLKELKSYKELDRVTAEVDELISKLPI